MKLNYLNGLLWIYRYKKEHKMAEISKKTNEHDFLHIISLINKAKEKALLSVNQELITLYFEVGKYISIKIKKAEWGESVVKELAEYISKKHPNLKGYSDKNLWRMRSFMKLMRIM